MKIKNLKTDEVKDVKEVAEEVGLTEDRIKDYVRLGRNIKGEKYIKWNEPEPVQEEAVKIEPKGTNIYDWVEVVRITSEYGDIIGEKMPFCNEVRAKIPVEILKKEGFDQVEKIRKFVCDEAKKVEIKIKQPDFLDLNEIDLSED